MVGIDGYKKTPDLLEYIQFVIVRNHDARTNCRTISWCSEKKNFNFTKLKMKDDFIFFLYLYRNQWISKLYLRSFSDLTTNERYGSPGAPHRTGRGLVVSTCFTVTLCTRPTSQDSTKGRKPPRARSSRDGQRGPVTRVRTCTLTPPDDGPDLSETA